MKRVCVIGAGFAGLALAIRLQTAGIDTVVVEAGGAPGGRAVARGVDGFAADAGTTVIADAATLDELWAGAGEARGDAIELLPLRPLFRLYWPDGAHFDLGGEAVMRAEIARTAPDDLAGYEAYAAFAAIARAEGLKQMPLPSPDGQALLRRVPALIRLQAWRSLHGKVAASVRSPQLRQALSFAPLLAGGNPLTVGAVYAAHHARDKETGACVAKGGPAALASALAALFTRAGGMLRLGDAAIRIDTIGTRAQGVATASGWHERFDAVVSDTDPMLLNRQLLADSPHAAKIAARLARRRWSPGQFTVHFAVEGSWPGIPHRTMLFGPRYRGLLADIFDHGVLPRDTMICLIHPSVTDPTAAPAGKSAFTAVVPVANLGRLPIDWSTIGPLLERRVIEEIGLRLIPDMADRLIASCHTTPADDAAAGAYLGSAFGLEPTWRDDLLPRHPARDPVIINLYGVGALGAVAGLSGALDGAKTTAMAILGDLRRAA